MKLVKYLLSYYHFLLHKLTQPLLIHWQSDHVCSHHAVWCMIIGQKFWSDSVIIQVDPPTNHDGNLLLLCALNHVSLEISFVHFCHALNVLSPGPNEPVFTDTFLFVLFTWLSVVWSIFSCISWIFLVLGFYCIFIEWPLCAFYITVQYLYHSWILSNLWFLLPRWLCHCQGLFVCLFVHL